MEDNIELTEQYKVLRKEFMQTRLETVEECRVRNNALKAKYDHANAINAGSPMRSYVAYATPVTKIGDREFTQSGINISNINLSSNNGSSSPGKKTRPKSSNASPVKKSTTVRRKKGSYARFPEKEGVERFQDPALS